MKENVPAAQSVGARRIFHLGNAALSAAVFFVTLVLALVALNPATSHYLLAARHRTPALNDSGTEVMAGFAPVVVEVNASTVLVVPAPTASSGTHRVSRKLTFLFHSPLFVATATAARTPRGNVVEGGLAYDNEQGVATLSDFVLFLLSTASGETNTPLTPSPSSTRSNGEPEVPHSMTPPHVRHRNVLHLCSALACTSPFVLQQWSNRGTAAAAMRVVQQPRSTADAAAAAASRFRAWRRVHNFALVFGEAQQAEAVTRALTEHHVLTSAAASAAGEPVAPLIGSLQDGNVVAACAASGWCRYSTAEKEAQTLQGLEAEADAVTGAAAKARIFVEWDAVRTGGSASGLPTFSQVRQLPLSSVVFGEAYAVDTVEFDLVYVDVAGEDTAAAVAFLHALTSLAVTSLPSNVLLTLYASDWLEEAMQVVEVLEAVSLYHVFPLVSQRRAGQVVHTGEKEGSAVFAMWRAAQWEWLQGREVATPFLSQSRVAHEPLVVVLLSRHYTSAVELQRAVRRWSEAATASRPMGNEARTPPSSSSVERFFYQSLNITQEEEKQMFEFFDDAEDAVEVSTGKGNVVQRLLRFLYQYIYFVIPLTVAGVLVWSLCRPRRSR